MHDKIALLFILYCFDLFKRTKDQFLGKKSLTNGIFVVTKVNIGMISLSRFLFVCQDFWLKRIFFRIDGKRSIVFFNLQDRFCLVNCVVQIIDFMKNPLKRTFSFSYLVWPFCLLILTSCSKEGLNSQGGLIDPGFKAVNLQTGIKENVIPIKADLWYVSYVKDALTGEILKDSTGKKLKLEHTGSIGVDGGWLQLEKTINNELKLTLLENFSDQPRNFAIGILSADKMDEVNFIQTRADGYELVKKEIEEVKESRKIYVSTEGCTAMNLVNSSNRERKVDITAIFKDVKYSSEFISDSYGAFDWLNKTDSTIFMDELMVNGGVRWQGKVPYSKGKTFENYIKSGDKQELLLKPNAQITARGEFKYLERTCNYIFTIKNKTSGHEFQVKGTWKQKVPLTPRTILQ